MESPKNRAENRMYVLKETAPIPSACGEGSRSLPLHTPLLLSPCQGKGLGGTVGAWLPGENEQQEQQNSEKNPNCPPASSLFMHFFYLKRIAESTQGCEQGVPRLPGGTGQGMAGGLLPARELRTSCLGYGNLPSAALIFICWVKCAGWNSLGIKLPPHWACSKQRGHPPATGAV